MLSEPHATRSAGSTGPAALAGCPSARQPLLDTAADGHEEARLAGEATPPVARSLKLFLGVQGAAQASGTD